MSRQGESPDPEGEIEDDVPPGLSVDEKSKGRLNEHPVNATQPGVWDHDFTPIA